MTATVKTPAKQLAAEVVQSEHDHHVPTAGAMTGHVLSNLVIDQIKFRQGGFYAGSRQVKETLMTLARDEETHFMSLAELMLDEGEVIPTTTGEFTKYTMIKENAANKYEDDSTLLKIAVEDLDTQNLFITRAIKLAVKEDKPALQAGLVNLLSFNQRQIRLLQGDLGRSLFEGREEDDDDDDE